MNRNSVTSITQQDLINYQTKMAAIRQNTKHNNYNIKTSSNIKEHKKLKTEALEQLNTILIEIDNSHMNIDQKIKMAKEAESHINNIINNDEQKMKNNSDLVMKRLQDIRDAMQKKINSEILSPSQKAQVEKYKKKRDKQKRNAIILWIITVLLCVLTIGILYVFLSKNLAEKQEEEFTDVDYKKQKNILDGATKDSQDAMNDDLARKLLGDDTSTISSISENKSIKEFTVTTKGKTTYYKYDKITDTLMSKSSIDQRYTTIDGGKNYLAKYFAGEGGIVVSDREGIEKIVKVGEDTYTYDYNSTDIIKNNTTYKKYPDGEPFFVKSYNSDDKYWSLISLIPPVVSGVAASLVTKEILSPGGSDGNAKKLLEKDEEYQQNKADMEKQYNDILENSNDNSTDFGGIGIDEGNKYGIATQILQSKYNDMTMQSSNNGITKTDLEVNRIIENNM